MKTQIDLTHWVLGRLNLDYEHMRKLAEESLDDLKHLRDYGDKQMVNITPGMIDTADYALFALTEVCHYDGDKTYFFYNLLEYRVAPSTRVALVRIIEQECFSIPRKGK